MDGELAKGRDGKEKRAEERNKGSKDKWLSGKRTNFSEWGTEATRRKRSERSGKKGGKPITLIPNVAKFGKEINEERKKVDKGLKMEIQPL